MDIRHSKTSDISRIMEIYAHARQFMADHGNPNQWGPTKWPPESLIQSDIAEGNSYVCIYYGRIVGTFYFRQGRDVEPTYRKIEAGSWLSDSPYGVVHRIATDGTVKGVGQYCIEWAIAHCGHLRMDTHSDNYVMQNLLKKIGLTYCGIIHVEEDDYPRLAYEILGNERIQGTSGK